MHMHICIKTWIHTYHTPSIPTTKILSYSGNWLENLQLNLYSLLRSPRSSHSLLVSHRLFTTFPLRLLNCSSEPHCLPEKLHRGALYIKSCPQLGVVIHTFNPVPGGGRGKWISMSLSPVWCREQVVGQPGLPTLTQRTNKNLNKDDPRWGRFSSPSIEFSSITHANPQYILTYLWDNIANMKINIKT